MGLQKVRRIGKDGEVPKDKEQITKKSPPPQIPKDKEQITKKSQPPTRKAPKRFWNFGFGPWNFFGPCHLSFGTSAQSAKFQKTKNK
jgi:hypothetical protein